MQVEHELPERALQPREAALQHDEARAGQLRRGLEIHLAERLAELEMLLRRERVIALRPEMMVLDIAVLVRAVRHLVERQVREFARAPSSSSVDSCLLLRFERRNLGLERARPRPSAPAARASSLLFFASPISFEAALRRACAASAVWIAARRRSSSAISRSRFTAASPRRASPRSKASGLSRIHLMSCMAESFRVMPAAVPGTRRHCEHRLFRTSRARSKAGEYRIARLRGR